MVFVKTKMTAAAYLGDDRRRRRHRSVSVSLDCLVFSTCVGRLQQCRVSEGKADGPRDWVVNEDRDIKVRSGA